MHYPLPLACVEPPFIEPLERSTDGLLRETGSVEGSHRESPAEAQLRAVSESSNNCCFIYTAWDIDGGKGKGGGEKVSIR